VKRIVTVLGLAACACLPACHGPSPAERRAAERPAEAAGEDTLAVLVEKSAKKKSAKKRRK